MNPTSNAQLGLTTATRMEWIADISLPNLNTQYMLPTNGGLIPNDRYIATLQFIVELRLTNPASGNPTGVLADAPWSLIESIGVTGYHRIRGANEPFILLRGVDLYNLVKCYNGPLQMTPSSGAPNFVPNLSVSANATNDIRFTISLPFWPLGIPLKSQIGWLLDAPNYDSLKLTINWADANSVFSGQTTQPTFSSYGSASGNPVIHTYGQFALGGNSLFGYVPGRVWRYWQENNSGNIVSGATNSREYNIPRGNRVRSVLVKSGHKYTGASSGNNPYDTTSDTILSNVKVMRGLNKMIRYYASFYALKQESALAYGNITYPSVGYGLIDFCENNSLAEVLNTVGLVAGPSGDTDLFVQADIAGASGQADLFLLEELRNIPSRLGVK